MDILEKVKKDQKLRDFFRKFGDFEPYDSFQNPEDLNGEMRFNISGMAFGCSGDGSEFVLLEDGTIALNGSEGETGRIAENMTDFFALLVHFPFFWDYWSEEIYQDENKDAFRKQYEKQLAEEIEDMDYPVLKAQVIAELHLPEDDDVFSHMAMKFYHAATRMPRYGYSYEGEYYDQLLTHTCYWL